MAGAEGGGYLCLPTWRRAGKRFQGRGVPPPVVYLVVGGSRAGSWAGGGRSSNACAISMKSPLVSAGHTCKRGAACVRTSFDISPNLKLNCQEPKLDSQLRVSANKAVAPSSWVHWFLCQLFAHGKKTPSGRCRRRATGRRVCSRSRPGCRRSAPRLRRPSTTLSLLQSPNWRPSEPHLASRSTHSRGQRLSGPTLRIAGSRSVLAVASELNN